MLENTKIKQNKADTIVNDEEIIVTPNKAKAEEVKKDESIFNN